MNWRLINRFCRLSVLVAGFGLMPMERAAAQTYTNLHSFPSSTYNGSSAFTNSDGANPYGGLIISSNTLFGTAFYGGTNDGGTVFSVNTDGSDFTNLHSFAGRPVEGANPAGSLVLSGNVLYGTTAYGGTNGSGVGTVFAIHMDGSGFTNLHSFANSPDGAHPMAGLAISGNTLFGTAQSGGAHNDGTVFAINTDGSGYTNLYSFPGIESNGSASTNSAGAEPAGSLIIAGNTLYGTAEAGGTNAIGTVFALGTNGTGFTTLYTFQSPNDGANPVAGLLISGNTLYGTTQSGGTNGNGTVFALNTNGTDFSAIYTFSALPDTTNSDGANPVAGLFLTGNTLYGTTQNGGTDGNGTVFAIQTDGMDFTNLHNFAGYPNDGAQPYDGVILTGSTLYGTTYEGGSASYGVVFGLSVVLSTPQPELAIMGSGTNVILTWPTNAAGFTLESNTNLGSPAGWIAVAPAPVVVNALNTVTNPISGKQMFYRLSQ